MFILLFLFVIKTNSINGCSVETESFHGAHTAARNEIHPRRGLLMRYTDFRSQTLSRKLELDK